MSLTSPTKRNDGQTIPPVDLQMRGANSIESLPDNDGADLIMTIDAQIDQSYQKSDSNQELLGGGHIAMKELKPDDNGVVKVSGRFKFLAGELDSLFEGKKVDKVDEVGGLIGLCEGLRSHLEKGISVNSANVDEDEVTLSRINEFGANVFPPPKQKTFWEFAWDAVTDTTLLVLCAAAVADLAVGIYKAVIPPPNREPLAWIEGVAILIAVVVIVLVNSVNDFRKQKQFLHLSNVTDNLQSVSVCRNGSLLRIPVSSIYVGDILSFEAGDMLPADGILVSGFNVIVDESSNTGESIEIYKAAYDKMKENKSAVVGDEKEPDCFLTSGSRVVDGAGKMIVLCVGDHSVQGKALALLRSADDDDDDMTPLQKKLAIVADQMSKWGLWIAIGFVAGLFIAYGGARAYEGKDRVGIINDCINVIITGITVVVIAVPEGLPVAVTLSLGFTTLLMLKDNNLVRHLAACETMGDATVICSDKTGTLTQNNMTVTQGHVAAEEMIHDGEVLQPSPTTSRTAPSTSFILPLIARSININSTAYSQENPQRQETHEQKGGLFSALSTSRALGKSNASFKVSSLHLVHHPAMEGPRRFIGSLSEAALLKWTESLGYHYDDDRTRVTYLDKFPFSSARKRMMSVVNSLSGEEKSLQEQMGVEKGCIVVVKGAAEIVLEACTKFLNGKGEVCTMSEEDRNKFEKVILEYSKAGLRTLGVSMKPIPASDYQKLAKSMGHDRESLFKALEAETVLLAILGLEDPIRAEVPEAVATCQRAGVSVRMVTGDALGTAITVARRCGILSQDSEVHVNVTGNNSTEDVVMTGPEFRKLSQEEMDAVIPRLKILARSSPADKQLLVRRLRELGEVVAVTGDGTNDAPALRSSDVGFAMGITGTEIVKEASDIVLLDDNFATLVKAIIWGRGVYDSIRKFLQFQLTVNVTAVVVTIITSFLATVGANGSSNGKTPVSILTVVQLLWINLIQDTFAALALATDAPSPEVLLRKPAKRDESLLGEHMWRLIATQSVYQIAVTLMLYLKGEDWFGLTRPDGNTEDMVLSSIVFNTFVWCNFFNLVNCREIHQGLNVFRNVLKNRLFIFIITMQIVVQIIIVEFGGDAFRTAPLSAAQWFICIGIGAGSLLFGTLVRLLPSIGNAKSQTGQTPVVLSDSKDGFVAAGIDAEKSV
ncbi:Calcium-transporting ATPase 10, plasma membrane-type [Blyttiomyces sp. JEL0837]|nr:Calcium-transporting ATPase 10, plasma membrane-type [Blyttiomyces sp. JEL0837]